MQNITNYERNNNNKKKDLMKLGIGMYFDKDFKIINFCAHKRSHILLKKIRT